ncbi:hypothetical protein HGM15179_020039, partial [Zosterops borbonicus]
PLPRFRPEPPRCRPAPAPAPAPAASPPLSPRPGQKAESAVPPAPAEKPPLERLYRAGPLLGSGGCGSVYSGTRLADGAPVRDGAGHDGAPVPLELVLLRRLPEGFALVMERPERCQDLWYFLAERGFLAEPVARGLFRQVLRAVRHCTSRGVLHRDIKAENVLVDLSTGEAKLIDFGCGTILQDAFYTRMAGTPEYCPPEWILLGRYHGQPATIWSLGVLLYHLVCGHLPFHTAEDIVRGQLSFPARVSPGWDAPSGHGRKNTPGLAHRAPAPAAGEEVHLLGSAGGGGTCVSVPLCSRREDRWEALGAALSTPGVAWAAWNPGEVGQELSRDSWLLSAECRRLIRWCLSMDPAHRPSLEDLLEHSWLQEPQLAQETAQIHPSAQ